MVNRVIDDAEAKGVDVKAGGVDITALTAANGVDVKIRGVESISEQAGGVDITAAKGVGVKVRGDVFSVK